MDVREDPFVLLTQDHGKFRKLLSEWDEADTLESRSLEADATMRDNLYKLERGEEGSDLTSPGGVARATGVIQAISMAEARHMEEEEKIYWPKLRARMSQEEMPSLYKELVRGRSSEFMRFNDQLTQTYYGVKALARERY